MHSATSPARTSTAYCSRHSEKRSGKVSPGQLLRHFEKNRFVGPSTVDTIDFKEFELRCLKLAKAQGFLPITVSPLTIFGTCSVVGFVDQNNVMTALRGTEVVADVTNVFALLIAKEFKRRKNNIAIKYGAVHRHVRTQGFSNPGFTPHFSILCLATGGVDAGNYSFELAHLAEHISTHLSVFSNEFVNEKFTLKIFLKEKNQTFHQLLADRLKSLGNKIAVEIEQQENPGSYYKLAQFKFFMMHHEKGINLSDGGFVDWTQKLIPNKKHRLMISGIGTELIHKIKYNQL